MVPTDPSEMMVSPDLNLRTFILLRHLVMSSSFRNVCVCVPVCMCV